MNDSRIARHKEKKGTMKSNRGASAKSRRGAGPFLSPMFLCFLVLAGCGGTPSSPSSSTTSANDATQTFQGVSNVSPYWETQYINPPSWTFVLGETESSFRYDDVHDLDSTSGINGVTSGTYSSDNGYVALTSSIALPTAPAGQLAGAGYALVIPGAAALLRPGNDTLAPVITAVMNDCSVTSSNQTYLFVALPGIYWNVTTSAAYGSIQASTDAAGTTWSFSKQSQSLLAGSGSAPAYPASFTGTCGQGISGYNVGVTPTIAWPYYGPTISVSPTGFFTETGTGSASGTGGLNPSEVQQPLVGVVAPSSALDTSSVTSAKYLGFMYESLPTSANQSLTTQIVSFGSVVAGSGNTITGGAFPNDDPSQTPVSNIAVNFGAQSATQNGLYTGATVTVADTTETKTGVNNCTNGGGVSIAGPNNTFTCSFPAVAVVGNPQSKFAIFLIGQDPTQGGAPFGLYLYQQ